MAHSLKISISNIAWPHHQNEQFLNLIKSCGCFGLEIAPGILWDDPVNLSKEGRRDFKFSMRDQGITLTAMQALLFGQKDLGLFRSKSVDIQTIEYLKLLCELSADLGIPYLIFGSPDNRRRGTISRAEALKKAVDFFIPVAEFARDIGVVFCIEPLRPQETDFVDNTVDGVYLVETINSSGFGLHLDGKAFSHEGGDFYERLVPIKKHIRHFHVNDPDLLPVNSTKVVKHLEMGNALKKIEYANYVSIEMRKTDDCFKSVQDSIFEMKKFYC